MTTPRPPGMSTGDWVEVALRQAEADGLFDRIDQAPDPMAGVDVTRPEDEQWWLRKLIAREGLTIMPEMLVVKKDIAQLHEDLPSITSQEQLTARITALNHRIDAVNLVNTSPVANDLARLDSGRLLARCRAGRPAR